MRDNDAGAIVVTEGDAIGGLVTDRDIVVRAIAGAESGIGRRRPSRRPWGRRE